MAQKVQGVFSSNTCTPEHVRNAEEKARRKLNIMKKLAGSYLDANEKILKPVYHSAV